MTMPLGTLECFLVVVQLNGQRVNHSLYYRYMCSIGLSALPKQIIFHLLLTYLVELWLLPKMRK